MNPESKNRIIADLEKSGFASEMTAIQICGRREWHCEGSATYFDRDQHQTREIDLVANLWARKGALPGGHVAFWFYIVAEIKRSKEPWIVFRQPVSDQRSHIPDELRDMQKLDAWNNLFAFDPPSPWRPILAPAISQHSLLSELGWKSYGIHEVAKDPKDKSRWYGAFVSASKAADEYQRQHERSLGISLSLGDERPPRMPLHLHFFQPVVILDGELLAADLKDDGKIELEEIGEAPTTFHFRSEAYDRESYRVDLVRIGRLDAYLERCEKRQEAILHEVGRLELYGR